MNYIEAPNEYEDKDTSIFLAGGIIGCPDWQKEMVEKLKDLPITILNPRRNNFPTDDPNAGEKQVKWEFKHLHKATVVSFWFAKETLNPITLFELGSCLVSDKKIFIGIHSDYEKRPTVIVQPKLVRPELEIVSSLEDLALQIKNWGAGK